MSDSFEFIVTDGEGGSSIWLQRTVVEDGITTVYFANRAEMEAVVAGLNAHNEVGAFDRILGRQIIQAVRQFRDRTEQQEAA